MKSIAIIGSTGSIGTQTLDIVRANKDINVVALAAGNNIELIEKQAREFKPRIVGISSEDKAKQLRLSLSEFDIRVVSGMDGLIEIATMKESDILVTAIVGMIGLVPTVAAIKEGKDIALANKETLVTAGHIIMPLAKEKGVKILPVDSEHSAIFQCLQEKSACLGSDLAVSAAKIAGDLEGSQISKLIITASGGPFRGRKKEDLKNVTVEDALKHPNWSMGQKITIDSATLVNKGLEVIEARWLFDIEPGNIEVVVQPQSIIHSMVEFVDGGILAQLGTADMKLPIQYALYYPDRRYLAGERLDFSKISEITIAKPDRETFRGLDFAYSSFEQGGSMPTVFNASNELAVALFLDRKIKFLQIYEIIEECMNAHKIIKCPNIDEVLAAEQWTYEFIRSKYKV